LPYEVPQEFFLNAEAQMMMGQIFNEMKTGKSYCFNLLDIKKVRAFFMSNTIFIFFLAAFILITSTIKGERDEIQIPSLAQALHGFQKLAHLISEHFL
jgi:hypothetical protein